MWAGTTALGPTNAAEASSSSDRWRVLLGGAVIVCAALVVYHNSFAVPFLLDDLVSITGNPEIRHLWPIKDVLSPSVASLVGGRPVVNLSFALNYAQGGLGVWGYHAVNLVIHILTGLALFGVVRRTLLRPALQGQFGRPATRLAVAVAVLWTVHPLQTEAVTYISERCESLMGLFYLLTLYCFIRGADSQRSVRWFTLSAMACLLGMASKEVMVTAPAMVFLYDRTFVSKSFRETWMRHGRLYLALASTWLLLGYLMVGMHYRGVGYGLWIPWWAYALTESRVVVQYLCLTLWPHPLVFDYGQEMTIWHIADMGSYALVLTLLLGGVLFAMVRQPAIGFVGIWFFLILAPSSSVVPVVGQPMAEHRMYLPLAAVVTLSVMVTNTLLGRRSGAVFLALAVGLGSLSTRRNQDYRTELSIWNDTLAKRPGNARAHNGLGNALGQVGRIEDAIGQYEQALQIAPDYADAHYNLGCALARVGRNPDAIGQYEQALRINPDYAEAHNNLGDLLMHSGRVTEAIEHLEHAGRIKPDYVNAYNLGVALYQIGKPEDAIEHYREALRIQPNCVEAQYALGIALERVGRIPEAMGHYQQALRIKPGFIPAQNALVRLQARP